MSGTFLDQGSQRRKELTTTSARDLDDSAHYLLEVYVDPKFVRDRMNFQFIHASFMVMIDSYPLYPYYCSPPSPRPDFHPGCLHLEQSFHGLYCTNACTLPMPCSLPLTLCSHMPLHPPMLLTSSPHWLHIGISWVAFKVLMAGVSPPEILIILGWKIRTCKTAYSDSNVKPRLRNSTLHLSPSGILGPFSSHFFVLLKYSSSAKWSQGSTCITGSLKKWTVQRKSYEGGLGQ